LRLLPSLQFVPFAIRALVDCNGTVFIDKESMQKEAERKLSATGMDAMQV
jgi:hypothetical protein